MSAGRWLHRGSLLATGHLPRRLGVIDQVVVSPATLVSPLVLEMLASAGIPLVRENPEPAARSVLNPVSAVSSPMNSGQAEGCGLLVAGQVRYEVVEQAKGEVARRMASTGIELDCGLWELKSAGWGEWLHARAERKLVHFGPLPEQVASVAMLVWGVPAASVSTVAQATRVMTSVRPRVLAVEMPGRTLFEVRHMVLLVAGLGG